MIDIKQTNLNLLFCEHKVHILQYITFHVASRIIYNFCELHGKSKVNDWLQN